MLLYLFIGIIVIISIILYAFFHILDKLVDESTNKKESFTNINDVKEESIENIIQKRGIINGVKNLLPSKDLTNFSGKNYRNLESGDDLIRMEIGKTINSPSTVSIPANKSDPIVHTDTNCTHPISLDKGKYTFPIQKYLYDGIWDRKVVSDGGGNQENDWNVCSNMVLEGSYATNNFIHTPRYNFIAGEKYVQPDCSEKEKDYYFDCNTFNKKYC